MSSCAGSFSPSSLCGVPFRITAVAEFPSKRSGFELSLEVERRSSLVSSRKVHAWRFRRSEEGNARDTLRCLADEETETDVDAGGGVVSEFEVEGKGEDVDVDVVMARVRIVADVDTLEDEGGITVNAFWKKAEEVDAIVRDGG